MMTDDETTTEQLAEIEGQARIVTPDDVAAQQLVRGLVLQVAAAIELEPEPQPEHSGFEGKILYEQTQPEPVPVQVREGRWRTRNGLVRDVTAMPTNHEDFAAAYPWWDGVSTWRNDGRWLAGGSTMDLLEYLGPIEEQPQPEPQAARIEELRSEVSYVQKLLGESRQRVTQLEELVSSLRTINDAQEKTVRAAGQENTDLQHRLNVVSAEWAEQVETVRKLRIELDAAQQVPQAVSDRFEEGWDAGTARAVETIAEWTEPFRRCGSERLAWMVMANLPHIMRTLTGLTPED